MYSLSVFFIRPSLDGHLGCFRVLAIVNSAAGNTGVHGSFRPCDLNLWLAAGSDVGKEYLGGSDRQAHTAIF